MSRAKAAPPAPSGTYDEQAALKAYALKVYTDPASSPEDRAAAQARLVAKPLTEDDLAAAMADLSPAALAALAELDDSIGVPIGVEGTTRPAESIAEDLSTRSRRDRAYVALLRASDECQRLAGIVARLDEELAADTARPTPAPPVVELAGADDETAPEPIVSEPVAAPRTPEEWRAHCRELVEKHRAAEAERSAARTRELAEWRERERAKIVERELREKRRRGEE